MGNSEKAEITFLSQKKDQNLTLNHFPELLENYQTRLMIDASDSEVFKESPRESLFKDRYFVSGIGSCIGSGIAKRSKDPAQV